MSTDHSTESDTGSGAAPVPEPIPPIPPRRAAVLVVLAAVAVVAVGLDQLTKALVVAHLEGGPPVKWLGGLIYLDVYRNPGAAFSLATGMTIILSVIAVAVVVGIIWVAPRLRSIGWAIALGLVLAGAMGNLSDRIFRAPGPLRGHVVDFISLFNPYGAGFAIFNLADSAITVGGTLMVLMALFGHDYDGGVSRRTRDAKALAAKAKASAKVADE